MKNFLQEPHIIDVIAPADVASGDLVIVGKLFGVAATSAKSGETVAVQTTGCFTLPKVSAQAITAGAEVYFDNTAKLVTTTATSNTLIGHAIAAAANPSGSIPVRLSI